MTDLAPDRQATWAPAWLVHLAGAASKNWAQANFVQASMVQRGLGAAVPTRFASRDLAVEEVAPTRLAGLQLWLDASELALADTDPVSSWTDVSGHGRHAVQAVAGKQPTFRTGILNGKPGVLFDGGDGIRYGAPGFSLGASTVFCVFKLIGAGILYEHALGSGAARYMFGTTGDSIQVQSASATSGKDRAANWAIDNVAKITSHVFNGTHASHKLYIDGTEQTMTDAVGRTGNPGTTLINGVWDVGSRNDADSLWSTGYIFELLVYDRLLNALERIAVENYLGRKYGITVTPSTPVPAFYHGRVLGEPVVDRAFFDSFYGVTAVTTARVRLANGDNVLDTLHTVDLRGTRVTLTRYDEDSGLTVAEFTGKVSTTALGVGWVDVTAVAPDLSVFEQLVPKGTVTGATFPNARDLGAAIPVHFGNPERRWCPYVNDDRTNDQYDYLVGRGAIAVAQLYRLAGDGSLHQVAGSEYTLETTRYSGLTTVRFTRRQVDWQNALYPIYADVTGLSAERNFARAVKTLLSDSTYGLGQSVNAASFTAAEAQVDPTTGTEVTGLYCDGSLCEPRAAMDVLRELLMVRGLRLNMNADGEWTVTVDTQQADVRMTVHDGTGDGARNLVSVVTPRERPPLENSVRDYRLAYKWDRIGGYRLEAARAVHSGVGRDVVLQNQFLRDRTAADKVVHYLSRREVYGNEFVDVLLAQEARQLAPGDRVTLDYAPLAFSSAPMEVRQVSKALTGISARLAPWNAAFYSYTAGTLPTDVTLATAAAGEMPTPLLAPAPATTPPVYTVAAPTALTARQGAANAVEVEVTAAEPINWAYTELYRGDTDASGSASLIESRKTDRFEDQNVTYLDPATPSAPTVAQGAAGNVNVGTHTWKVSFYRTSPTGETLAGTASAQLNVAGSASIVNLTSVPTGPAGTTARRVYRTVTGDTGNYLYVGVVSDNTTTTFADNVADASLGAAASIVNTFPRTYYYWAKVVDLSGNKSGFSPSASVTVAQVQTGDVKNLNIGRVGRAETASASHLTATTETVKATYSNLVQSVRKTDVIASWLHFKYAITNGGVDQTSTVRIRRGSTGGTVITAVALTLPGSKGSVTVSGPVAAHQLEAPESTGNFSYYLTLENSYGGAGTGITVTGVAFMAMAKSA